MTVRIGCPHDNVGWCHNDAGWCGMMRDWRSDTLLMVMTDGCWYWGAMFSQLLCRPTSSWPTAVVLVATARGLTVLRTRLHLCVRHCFNVRDVIGVCERAWLLTRTHQAARHSLRHVRDGASVRDGHIGHLWDRLGWCSHRWAHPRWRLWVAVGAPHDSVRGHGRSTPHDSVRGHGRSTPHDSVRGHGRSPTNVARFTHGGRSSTHWYHYAFVCRTTRHSCCHRYNRLRRTAQPENKIILSRAIRKPLIENWLGHKYVVAGFMAHVAETALDCLLLRYLLRRSWLVQFEQPRTKSYSGRLQRWHAFWGYPYVLGHYKTAMVPRSMKTGKVSTSFVVSINLGIYINISYHAWPYDS